MDVGDTSFVGNSGANNLHHINDVSESKNASSKTCDRYSRTVQFQQKFVSFLRRNTVIQKPGNSSFLSRETRGECKKHISLLGVNCRIVHLLLQKISFFENLQKHIHTITANTNFRRRLFSHLMRASYMNAKCTYHTPIMTLLEVSKSRSHHHGAPLALSFRPLLLTHCGQLTFNLLQTLSTSSVGGNFSYGSQSTTLLSIHFLLLPVSPHQRSVRSPRAFPAHGSDGDRRRGHPPLAGAAGGLLPGQRVNVRAANGPGLRGHAYATAAGTGVTSPPASFFAPAHTSLFQSGFFLADLLWTDFERARTYTYLYLHPCSRRPCRDSRRRRRTMS